MIEINLLPQEYRVQERTPLGLFLTIVVGVCMVGGVGVYEIGLKKELDNKNARNKDLTADRDRKKSEKEKIDKLQAEIKTAEKRQNTIIEISQSKIVWSHKLVQFGKIMSEYPEFWIDRLNLAKGGLGNGTLTLNFYAVGNDLRKVAAFRERLTSDTNFWYHFDKMNAPRTFVPPNGGSGLLSRYGYNGPITYFDVTIPVK